MSAERPLGHAEPPVAGRAWALRSRRVITARGERPATVHIHDGRIAGLTRYEDGDTAQDLGDLVLMPGLVDTHVHVNEPGRTEWEGFATATRAAAAGGVTTIVDMPLNSIPPTTSARALAVKRAAAAGQCLVDVGFWGGVVPDNLGALRELHDAGVFGFKCFLADSGVPEFPPLSLTELDRAMRAVDALFLVHAEDPAGLAEMAPSRRYRDFLRSRPPDAEDSAVAGVLRLVAATGRRAHVLHLSSAHALDALARARAAGLPVSAETCPHYLTLTAEEIADGATEYKCCPPIRPAANREALWRGLAAGVLDQVVSDHSPCAPDLKRRDSGDFRAAWGGIASLQLGLPLVWTAARARGYALADVVGWMARRPAEIAGLAGKGRIALGYDADLVAFDPDSEFVVDPGRLHHRHPVTPYAGQRLTGVVRRVWLRGTPVTERSTGRLLTRGVR